MLTLPDVKILIVGAENEWSLQTQFSIDNAFPQNYFDRKIRSNLLLEEAIESIRFGWDAPHFILIQDTFFAKDAGRHELHRLIKARRKLAAIHCTKPAIILFYEGPYVPHWPELKCPGIELYYQHPSVLYLADRLRFHYQTQPSQDHKASA